MISRKCFTWFFCSPPKMTKKGKKFKFIQLKLKITVHLWYNQDNMKSSRYNVQRGKKWDTFSKMFPISFWIWVSKSRLLIHTVCAHYSLLHTAFCNLFQSLYYKQKNTAFVNPLCTSTVRAYVTQSKSKLQYVKHIKKHHTHMHTDDIKYLSLTYASNLCFILN